MAIVGYPTGMPDYRDHTHSEARRDELGKDRLFLRPPKPTTDRCDALAAKLGTSRSLAAAYAIQLALRMLEDASERDVLDAKLLVRELEGVTP